MCVEKLECKLAGITAEDRTIAYLKVVFKLPKSTHATVKGCGKVMERVGVFCSSGLLER